MSDFSKVKASLQAEFRSGYVAKAETLDGAAARKRGGAKATREFNRILAEAELPNFEAILCRVYDSAAK